MDGESKSMNVVRRDELSWTLVVERRMTDHHFDALQYVHQLTRAGVPLAQAEAHANALAGVLGTFLVTVTDVAVIKQSLVDLNDRVSELSARIDRLDTRMSWALGLFVATQLCLFGLIGGLYLAH
jgi:hypothetical protein